MSRRRDCVFLIRMWRDGNHSGDGIWRGSIHDVTTGRRRYVIALGDVTEFIVEALHAEPAPTEPPFDNSH